MEVDIAVVVDPAVEFPRLDPLNVPDPAAEFPRLDPLVVDALLGMDLPRLEVRPMRAGESDCSRRLFLDMDNHKLYSLCLLLE